MAIVQYNGYTFPAWGDGSSKTLVIDMYNRIAADSTIHNKTPSSILSISGGGSTPAISLVGTVVTLTWTTAPASGAFSVSLSVGF